VKVYCSADPLLGNDHEKNNGITFTAGQQILNKQVYTAVTGQRLRKQTCFHRNDWSKTMNGVFYAVLTELL
jgi:hypothetical protein